MKEEVRRNNLELRGLRSFQDGNENRGQLFALLSQRSELFYADNPRFHEQFQPVGALTRCLPSSSPAASRVLTIYVAVTRSILQSRAANPRISR
jgi:hypothetical protein